MRQFELWALSKPPSSPGGLMPVKALDLNDGRFKFPTDVRAQTIEDPRSPGDCGGEESVGHVAGASAATLGRETRDLA